MDSHEIPIGAEVQFLCAFLLVIFKEDRFVVHVLSPLNAALLCQFLGCHSGFPYLVELSLTSVMRSNEPHYTPWAHVEAMTFNLDPSIDRYIEMIFVKPVLTQTDLSRHQKQIGSGIREAYQMSPPVRDQGLDRR